MVSLMYSLTRLTVLALLTGCTADGLLLTESETSFTGSKPEEPEVNLRQELNTSALNTVLAFEPYHDLAKRNTTEHGVRQQDNILFSPLGLASAVALLSRVSGSESQRQALEALGLAASSAEHNVETTISTLTSLLRNLTLQGGGVEAGVQRADPKAGAGTEAEDTAGEEIGGVDTGNRADVEKGAEGWTGNEDTVDAGGQLRVWTGLHADGKHLRDFDSFLSGNQHKEPSAFNLSLETLKKDLQVSDRLELNNYVYFKGRQPFERRHTVPRRFHLNATASVEVAMMFRDDTCEVMMLYDTNCSATVVRLAQSQRLATLLLLPKAELQPLEECLSDSRMSFWLSNLKPGRAEILFPKFQLRKSYSLENLLRNSGLSPVFSASADFSPISQKKTLRLVKAPHEVMLEMEETKLEDWERTDILLDFSVPPRITFNRPFMVIIYDDLTGLILLIGRIADPTG